MSNKLNATQLNSILKQSTTGMPVLTFQRSLDALGIKYTITDVSDNTTWFNFLGTEYLIYRLKNGDTRISKPFNN